MTDGCGMCYCGGKENTFPLDLFFFFLILGQIGDWCFEKLAGEKN